MIQSRIRSKMSFGQEWLSPLWHDCIRCPAWCEYSPAFLLKPGPESHINENFVTSYHLLKCFSAGICSRHKDKMKRVWHFILIRRHRLVAYWHRYAVWGIYLFCWNGVEPLLPVERRVTPNHIQSVVRSLTFILWFVVFPYFSFNSLQFVQTHRNWTAEDWKAISWSFPNLPFISFGDSVPS